jgi:hypothetical protein
LNSILLTFTFPSSLSNQYFSFSPSLSLSPPRSPYDRETKLSPNTIANLRPDEALAGRIREYQAKRKQHADDNLAVSGGVTSVEELGKFYHALDEVRDILNTTLEGWEAPQVIVVGDQSSGKSTVLERITMLPVFPKDKKMCTRMPVKVKLRRGPQQMPRLITRNLTTGGLEQLNIPVVSGMEDVARAMEAAVAKEQGSKRGICQEHILELHITSPSNPNLDLLDLPGIVTATVDGEPDDLPQQTRDLVDREINKARERSVYLVVVEGFLDDVTKASSLAIAKKHNLQEQCIGVYTKTDRANSDESDDGRPYGDFQDRVMCKEGSGTMQLGKHGERVVS